METDKKTEVRKRFLQVRGQIPADLAREKSRRITDKMQQLEDYRKAETIHCYASMASRNEADTFELIELALSQGKRVVVPVMKGDGELIHSKLHDLSDLKENSWGVPEPANPEPVQLSEIDLVIVPMVAGDAGKNRIGYGAGYYDRFLSKTDAMTVGILFEEQLSKQPLPSEPFDVPLKMIITDERIIE